MDIFTEQYQQDLEDGRAWPQILSHQLLLAYGSGERCEIVYENQTSRPSTREDASVPVPCTIEEFASRHVRVETPAGFRTYRFEGIQSLKVGDVQVSRT